MPGLWESETYTSVFPDLYLQGNVIDNFCCSAAVDASKCKGGDKWKYAGMVVKDKVWYPWFHFKSDFFSSPKEFANVLITGIVSTSGANKTIGYKRADGDHRINSTQELTLTVQYTGWESRWKYVHILSNPQICGTTKQSQMEPGPLQPAHLWSLW